MPQAHPTPNLPRFTGAFVGRDTEILAPRRHIEDHRLLTLVGPAGVGRGDQGQRVHARSMAGLSPRPTYSSATFVGPARNAPREGVGRPRRKARSTSRSYAPTATAPSRQPRPSRSARSPASRSRSSSSTRTTTATSTSSPRTRAPTTWPSSAAAA